MEPEIKDAPEVLETPEVAVETTETPEPEAQQDEEKVQLKSRLEEVEKKNKQLFERLKKQEKEVKEVSTEAMTPKDFLAIKDANVSAEDYDELVRMAKIVGKPIHEALQDPAVKTVLQTRIEERRSAQTTQVKGAARGASKPTGVDLMHKFDRTGEIPDSDEGAAALFQARLERRLGKK